MSSRSMVSSCFQNFQEFRILPVAGTFFSAFYFFFSSGDLVRADTCHIVFVTTTAAAAATAAAAT